VRDWKSIVETYLDSCNSVRRLSRHTIDAYRNDLGTFVARIGGANGSIAEIRDVMTKIAEDANLSPATVKRRIAAIRTFLRAVDEVLAFDTFKAWKLKLRAPKRLPRALPKQELVKLLSLGQVSAPSANDFVGTTHLCLSLIAATGMRVSELCSLTVGDVKSRTGEIRVFGKGARERMVIVANKRVRDAILRYVTSLPESTELCSPLFRNSRGRALTPQCLRLRLHSIAKRTKVGRKVTPHMLRHTAATLLLEGGVDIRFVQRLLGHASITTTQIYTHVSDVALRSALERADVMRALV